ncbi:TOBE domain-containing protein [Rhodovulum marinum]|uniref:Molybdate transport system regulatory protein n=1 Tax=Rhodovulum marinum TaxID=320662 RepID=A0A4R2Q419_9RHOB|nr:TOBE domain-containing protein [Rhodovulum marinum]TCP43330.1 molybdate transport system regulatory protein [Rhodovulum marinum]
MPDPTLQASLTLAREGRPRIGGARIRLLEAIAAEGSIAGAARAAGLSYKGAWDAVTAMNNLFARPLVDAAPGGRAGGGAQLTPAGRAVLDRFSRIEAGLARALSALDADIAEPGQTVSDLIWSLAMQTSTRNTFRCTVETVTQGTVSAEIGLAFGDGQRLTAVITERSAAEMGLAPGREVFALVKASFVILAAGDAPLSVSACNSLPGTVVAREDGPVNSEIVLDLGAGKSLTAVVTQASAQALGLTPGSRATALVKASHVILALP